MITIAYVSVPKDLTVVKSKLAFNLTKRQLICFGLGVVVSVPTYFFLKANVITDLSVLFLIAIAMPFFFLGIYEKNGLPFEKIFYYVLRVKFFSSAHRTYETENFYRKLQTRIDQGKEQAPIVKKEKTSPKAKKDNQ